ncbi:GCG_CRPN prefix-to-repeats domain-containing protein [Methylobacterium sp. SI9]|uniref:GCG_CRPN prefix-to-repeats domain-containing protein n=1 Tax=Methylobacterium guangdongense TaxID=3138811 RepID=UPI00313B2837
MVRSKVLGMAAVIAAGLATATTANAAPFGYGPTDDGVLIERVAGGCGPGFHPNPWGRCRPNDRDWGYGGSRGYYGGGPGYGYGGGYERGPRGYYGGYDGPRRFYGGY